MSEVDQLEREIARQVKRTKEIERIASVKEAAKAKLELQASLRKQANKHVQATLNKPAVKHQTQLPTQPEAKQTKLQPEQPQQLVNQLDDQMTKINELLVSLGGKPIVKAVTTVEVTSTASTIKVTNNITNPDALSADEEQYQAAIVQGMVALIKQRKLK
jgi:hypothetical protein